MPSTLSPINIVPPIDPPLGSYLTIEVTYTHAVTSNFTSTTKSVAYFSIVDTTDMYYVIMEFELFVIVVVG